MRRVEQKQTGVVHLVDDDDFTLCGRWAGRRPSFRKTLATATCRRCKASRKRRREAEIDARYDQLRAKFTGAVS